MSSWPPQMHCTLHILRNRSTASSLIYRHLTASAGVANTINREKKKKKIEPVAADRWRANRCMCQNTQSLPPPPLPPSLTRFFVGRGRRREMTGTAGGGREKKEKKRRDRASLSISGTVQGKHRAGSHFQKCKQIYTSRFSRRNILFPPNRNRSVRHIGLMLFLFLLLLLLLLRHSSLMLLQGGVGGGGMGGKGGGGTWQSH